MTIAQRPAMLHKPSKSSAARVKPSRSKSAGASVTPGTTLESGATVKTKRSLCRAFSNLSVDDDSEETADVHGADAGFLEFVLGAGTEASSSNEVVL